MKILRKIMDLVKSFKDTIIALTQHRELMAYAILTFIGAWAFASWLLGGEYYKNFITLIDKTWMIFSGAMALPLVNKIVTNYAEKKFNPTGNTSIQNVLTQVLPKTDGSVK